jgi:alpha-D-ribose 1-methylphosphonate 5-triphosphate synthase subunit PhnG
MLRAEDSLDQQEFLLGEALTTSCEVSINTVPGYGLCLGEEPVRAYCSAVLDSLREQNLIDPVSIAALQSMHDKLIEDQRAEYAQILRTQVDFKLLEQE